MTLSVKHAEANVREGSSPLSSYSSTEGGTTTRFFRVRWDDRVLAQRQLVGYSFPSVEDLGDGNGPVTVLRRELPDQDPTDPQMLCHRAELVKGEEWIGRNEFDRLGWNNQDLGGGAVGPLALAGFPNKDKTNDADGIGDTNWKTNVYKNALIRAEYKLVDYYVRPDDVLDRAPFFGSELYRFVQFRRDRAAKYLGLPAGSLYWVGTPGAANTTESKAARLIAFSIGKIEGQQTLYFKQLGIADGAVPRATIDAAIGKVNNKTFLSHAPGTLLYMPPKEEFFVMAGGVTLRIGINLEHTMIYVPVGHNKLLRAVKDEPTAYYYVSNDGTIIADPNPLALPAGKFLYDSTDFDALFLPRSG